MRLRTYHPFKFLQKLLARRTVLLNKNESERYAEQNRRMFQTTSEELWVFLGITILMGINKLPKMRDYLSVEEGLCAIVIQKTVTINRFLEILQNIHFTNNLQQHPPKDSENYDCAWKLRPLFDHQIQHFQDVLQQKWYQSINEHMCKFKGKSLMCQDMKKPQKAHQMGIQSLSVSRSLICTLGRRPKLNLALVSQLFPPFRES